MRPPHLVPPICSRTLRSIALATLALSVGCGDSPTQLVVSVCSDYGPSEIGSLRVEVVAADAPAGTEGEVSRWQGRELPLSFGVVGRAGRQVQMRFELFDPAGVRIAERLVRTGFAPGVSTPVTVRLAASCRPGACPESTCGPSGECVPVDVPLEDWASRTGLCEAAPVDAFVPGDGGVPDADSAVPDDGGPMCEPPGTLEFCSGVDEDCDGAVDEGAADGCSPDARCDQGCIVDEPLAVGGDVACLASGTDVRCWGRAQEVAGGHAGALGLIGETVWPEPRVLLDTGATQVALGAEHGCARLVDGSLRCWGSNRSGQLGVGDTRPRESAIAPAGIADPVVQVAVGDRFSCALTAPGHVYCWGKNEGGELGLGDFVDRSTPTRLPLERVVELRAGGVNACARDAERVLRCWGASTVGSGDELSDTPVEVAREVDEVAMGGRYLGGGFFVGEVVACARSAGAWSCWGLTSLGATGTGAVGEVATPRPLTAIADAVSVAPSGARSCGIDGEGVIRCWGSRADAALGTPVDGPPVLDGVETTRDADATELACGLAGCCTLAPGPDVRCWGDPLSEVHGDGTRRDGSGAGLLALPSVASLAIGADHGCAVSSGAIHCWGRGGPGLGVGDAFRRFEPVAIGLDASEVVASSERTCASTSGGAVHCWGSFFAGDAAETGVSSTPLAVDASAMGAVTAITTAQSYTCALATDGAAWCWGGSSEPANRLCGGAAECRTPTAVQTTRRFVDIDAGRLHVCALEASGSVWCWGAGSNGRLGREDASWADQPVQVAGIDDAVELAVQETGGCVRHDSGRVSCWGLAAAGQTGDGGGGSPRTSPVEVAGLTDAVALECWDGCLAKSASRGWLGWGANTNGTLGDGTRIHQLIPAPAAHGLDFASVVMGGRIACGILDDGTARCWGGLGTTSDEALGYAIFSAVAL